MIGRHQWGDAAMTKQGHGGFSQVGSSVGSNGARATGVAARKERDDDEDNARAEQKDGASPHLAPSSSALYSSPCGCMLRAQQKHRNNQHRRDGAQSSEAIRT